MKCDRCDRPATHCAYLVGIYPNGKESHGEPSPGICEACLPIAQKALEAGSALLSSLMPGTTVRIIIRQLNKETT